MVIYDELIIFPKEENWPYIIVTADLLHPENVKYQRPLWEWK